MPPPRQYRLATGTRAAIGAMLVALALALAGCGGKPVTRAGVIARANAICDTAARAEANVPATGTGQSGSTLASRLQAAVGARQASIFTREARALDALPVPHAQRALFLRFIAAEDALAAGARRLVALRHDGDTAGVQRALTLIERNDAPRLAGEYGMTECSGARATFR